MEHKDTGSSYGVPDDVSLKRRTLLLLSSGAAIAAAGCSDDGDRDENQVDEDPIAADRSGHQIWDVLLTEEGGEFEGVDALGESLFSTSSAQEALNEATIETPEGGTLGVKGHYVLGPGDVWTIDKDVRLIGHGAHIETENESRSDGEFFVSIEPKASNTYVVEDITHGDANEGSNRPILHFDEDVAGDVVYSDLIMLQSEEAYPQWDDGPESQEKGEGHMIAADPESDPDEGDIWDDLEDNEISLMEPLEFDYDNDYDIEVVHYQPITVHVEGFAFTGSGIWNEIGALALEGGANCTFRDLSFENLGYEQFRVASSYDTRVDNSTFTRGARNSDGYGIVMKGGCAHTHVSNSTFHMMRHGVAHAGSGYAGYNRRNSLIENCLFTYHRSTALDMHGEDMNHRVVDCTFHLGHDEAIKYGRDTIIEGCYFNMDRGEDDALYSGGQWDDRDLVVSNCYFRGADRAIRADRDTSGFDSITISGCHFEECNQMVRVRSECHELTISGNTSKGGGADQIYVASLESWEDDDRTWGVHSGSITGNTFRGVEGGCIRAENAGGPEGSVVMENIAISSNQAIDCDRFIRANGTVENLFVHGNQMTGGDEFIEVDISDDDYVGDWVVADNVFRDVDEVFGSDWDSDDHEVRDDGGWEF